MTTITYQEIQLENLIKIDYSQIITNFRTFDAFMKNMSTFQRKVTDIEKVQKAISLDLNNFKVSTTNSFNTMNEVLDSRGSISKGGNKVVEEAINDVKAQMKELKLFVTESTRELNDSLESKQKETQEVYNKFQEKFKQLNVYHESDKLRIESLQQQIYSIKSKFTQKTQTELVKTHLKDATIEIDKTREELDRITTMLSNLGVQQFKNTLDKMSQELYSDMDNLKMKFKLKTDVSDTLKLQQMLLNTINLSYQNIAKKHPQKAQTKKALMFLEKKMNSIIQCIMGGEEGQKEKDGLVATKGWRCISCSKDLQEYEGKLDQYKPWNVFPVKDPNNKDKYGGFGSGFHSIIETVITKKGADVGFDEKGRMTTPFNLARESRGSLKASQSHTKLERSKQSPVRGLAQSNYMSLFGRSSEVDLDIRVEYLTRQKGLNSTIKKQTEK